MTEKSDELINFISIIKKVDDLYLKVPPEDIIADHNLILDLGIDSLGKVSIFYEVCDVFKIECDENSIAPWYKVSDIIDFIKANNK